MKTNVLYFGDNLRILQNHEYFPDECVEPDLPRPAL